MQFTCMTASSDRNGHVAVSETKMLGRPVEVSTYFLPQTICVGAIGLGIAEGFGASLAPAIGTGSELAFDGTIDACLVEKAIGNSG
jgi:hypothetical protein